MEKSKAHYFEKNGRYYVQYATWWEKHGYYVPQSPKRISKKEYEFHTKKQEGNKHDNKSNS